MLSAPGISPLPRPERLVQTPADWPVGSGRAGFDGTVFILEKYDGGVGGDAMALDIPGVNVSSGFAAQVAVLTANKSIRAINSIENFKHFLVHITIMISFDIAEGGLMVKKQRTCQFF
jgi:hypothetical protein